MIQGNVLAHLLASTTLERITDSRLYGNKYSVVDMMTDLTNACFREDLAGMVNTFRQNLQIDYVQSLAQIASLNSKFGYDNVAKSAAIGQLKAIKQMMVGPAANAEVKAHREHILLLIEDALTTK
jgi:hypothetical protein